MYRRLWLKLLSLAPLLTVLTNKAWPSDTALIKKKISSSEEEIPVIGIGTWITFNVCDH